MSITTRSLFGVIAALAFVVGIITLAAFVPDYSQVQQTISEIGEVGSPVQIPFAILLCVIAACVFVFGTAVSNFLRDSGHSQTTFFLIAAMAICAAGVGIFAYPHPLHNVFGTSELIGYQAPLALFLTLRRDEANDVLARLSLIGTILVWFAIVANLVVFDRGGELWAHMRPFYGLVQRSLFASWFAWSAAIGIALHSRYARRIKTKQTHHPTVPNTKAANPSG